jgi:hypothetical protein
MGVRRTRSGLLARLERLEFEAAPILTVCLQYGWLRKLPLDYQGERHVEIVERRAIREDLEWIEAEEVRGPQHGVMT